MLRSGDSPRIIVIDWFINIYCVIYKSHLKILNKFISIIKWLYHYLVSIYYLTYLSKMLTLHRSCSRTFNSKSNTLSKGFLSSRISLFSISMSYIPFYTDCSHVFNITLKKLLMVANSDLWKLEPINIPKILNNPIPDDLIIWVRLFPSHF